MDPWPVCVRSVVERLALGQVSIRVLRFPPASIIDQCSVFIFIHVLLLPEGQTCEARETSEQECWAEVGKKWIEKYFDLAFQLSRPLRSQHRSS